MLLNIFLVFYIRLVCLLPLTDKISKHSNFVIIVFIEIEAIAMAELYLKQIVI